MSIMAHALRKAGIISCSRGRIGIMNARARQAVACECHRTVKAGYKQWLSAAR
jgi:hypothetical protein